MEQDLERFVRAQEADDTYRRALAELVRGRKSSHWMWFVFPQLTGLGRSDTARRFALSDLSAARAYLAHPLLGPRLLECARAVADGPAPGATALLGEVDALKLRSSMTLFQRADPVQPVFGAVLLRYYDGEPDPATERLL